MAIEKMVLLKIMGSLDNLNPILKELIFCENAHLNLNVENSSAYSDYLAVHKYESEIIGLPIYNNRIDPDSIHNICSDCLGTVENLSQGLGLELKTDKKLLMDKNYGLEQAQKDLAEIQSSIGAIVGEINLKKQQINELLELRERIDGIIDKDVNFSKITDFNYFDFELGSFSVENKSRLKKNYQTLSAIILKIGNLKNSSEDLYLIIYPKQYKEELDNLLKSLNWNKLTIPTGYKGTPVEILMQIDSNIDSIKNEIDILSNSIEDVKEINNKALLKIYNVLKLEDKIAEIEQKVIFGNNAFAVDVWVRETDKKEIEKAISKVANNYRIIAKETNDFGDDVLVPTKLKNNWFSWPFETIVKMYGLPSYNEIDPTPFLAITYCIAWGIMFGDIGQGLVYFLAGYFLRKKMPEYGHILMRLGGFSIAFGFVYGSFFGLEKKELPWLPSLIDGGPLSPKNIPSILLVGVAYGIIVLTASYAIGIVNQLRRNNIEEGIFGKNGIFGYLFFISLVLSVVSITGIIPVSTSIFVTVLLISLVVIILKEPLANMFLKKPLFPHGAGEYFTEAIFEGVETILNALSNSISFVRVGAFALNHAGLFLAFLVMAEIVTNPVAKIIILVAGNLLILTLEGLIVFIQGLRLQFYEMFSKYFEGNGAEFKPIKLN